MLVLNSILLPELYQNVLFQMRHCQYHYYINCTMKLIIMLISLLGVWGLLYLLSDKRLVQIYNAAAVAKLLQSCLTLCDPTDGSPPGSPPLGFSRQEHWSGLPFPSPVRESEVAQSCPTLSDPMDCRPPGSSVHGIFQARVLKGGTIAFSGSSS